MEERSFTWFPKLTRVMAKLPAELAGVFAAAVAEYGTNGAEPSFDNALMGAVFEGVREDIDNSVAARTKNKGGRPPKQKAETEVSTDCEPQETPVSEVAKPKETPVFDFAKPTETEENPSYIYQAIPSHTKPKKREGGARMARPTLEEVEAEIKARGYHVDARAFIAYYDSNGWKVGKNPMKSWKSALTTWERRDSGKAVASDADFSRFG
ncbi:hypothetical protein [Slackia isoflavoniconvertens]|uniref:hypothetical protein n=1 Tax=Slackia isoflavoniconvertens TaxID=572010 RepID=UPI003AB9973F